MKRIILLLMLIPNIVLADVVYTEYEEYLRGSSEYLEESDTLKREEYKIYNTYVETIEEFYQKLDNNLDESYTIDYSDYIYEEQNQLNYNEFVYDYQTKCLNNNYTIKNIRLAGFTNRLKISEIEINLKDNVDYILKPIYFTGSKQALQDKELYGNTLSTTESTEIGITFYGNINLSNIEIKLYFPNQEIDLSNLIIILNKDIDDIKLSGDFKLIKEKDNVITITFDNEYKQFLNKNNFETNNECISYYASKTPLYKYTKRNVIPLNNYLPLNAIDSFLLDDHQIKYNYYKREKVEIVDNIYLKNSKFDLKNYILSSTIPIEDLTIKENIDYHKSGIYNLEIYYQNILLIQKPITYEIKESVTEKVIIEEKNITEKPVPVSTKSITTKKVVKQNKIKTTTIKPVLTTKKLAIKKLNNSYQIKKDSSQNILVITIISFLIVLLVIFEFILLYVKRKYY